MAPPVPLATSVPFFGCTADQSVTLARQSRDWGYTAAWGSEVNATDGFTPLAALAVTSDLDLGVAVVPAQTRTAFVLGMTAATLADLSGGRFALGIGASSEVLVSRFGGQPFDRPLSAVREMAEALKPILAGQRSVYDGEQVKVGGYKVPFPFPPVPLYLGSLNRSSLRLAGELADGLCLNQMTVAHTPTMIDEVRRGADEAGRELPTDFPVVARFFVVVTDDVAAARPFVRAGFAPYVATSGYARFYRAQGFGDEVDAIVAANERGDRDAMVSAFSDRMVDDVFLLGDVEHVCDRIAAYVEAGVTVPVIAPLAPGLDAATETLRAVGEAWNGR